MQTLDPPVSTDISPTSAPSPAPRSAHRLEWIALFAALAPLLAITVWALVTHWMPQFDAGYFSVRSRDVFTRHHPLVGAWSSGSRRVGDQINNLGPLQLDLLAPFTKVSPYWGTGVGTATINATAVVGVWIAARRLFGQGGVIGAMAATIFLELSMGGLFLIEPRQQLAMLVPFWCLLWLCAALWSGHGGVLPAVVLTASLVLQTHLTYSYIVVALVASSIVAWLVNGRPHQSAGRHLGVAMAIGVVAWIQPVLDQAFGTGNLLRAVRQRDGGDQNLGYASGVRSIADATLDWSGLIPGSMGEYRPAVTDMSTGRAWALIAVWTLLLTGVVIVGRRCGKAAIAALGCVGLVAMAAAVYSSAIIPPGIFGIQSLNYYWMWPIALFAATAIAGAVIVGALGSVRRMPRVPPILRLAPVTAVIVAALVAMRPIGYVHDIADEAIDGPGVSRPLLEQLDESLSDLDVDGPVRVDRSRQAWVSYTTYTMLVELQRHDIEFTFTPGTDDVARFGSERCDDGSALQRIVMATGKKAARPLSSGETLLAEVDGMSAGDVAGLAALDAAFGRYLRDGTVEIDERGAGFYGGDEVRDRILAVQADPDAAATGLAGTISLLSAWGPADIPSHLRDDLQRWQRLQTRATKDRVKIYLAPIAAPVTGSCDG